MNRRESNKMIAEFMGIPKCTRCDECNEYKYGSGVYFNDITMEYDFNWNWLMPVIEKVCRYEYERHETEDRDNKYMHIETAYPRTFGMINSQTGNFMFRFNRCCVFEAPTLIKAAYMAVVDFIESLNSQNQQQNEQ